MASAYRIASELAAPFLPLWLELRRFKGKEDASRGHERFGHASAQRPLGTLVWIHAASVGEANSVLLFIELLKAQYSALNILLTTGTVTSANLMQKRLPAAVIHQYVPVDTPAATERFMRHWKPDIALWVESEFWPNLIDAANHWQCFMGVINARMSEKSFRMWGTMPGMIRPLMQAFNIAYAQSEGDAKRLLALGAYPVETLGNLKYDAATLTCNEQALLELRNITKGRKLWLAASTHPKEEALLEKTHRLLAIKNRNLLTIIVPRHPARGQQIASELGKKYKVAMRSKKETVTADTHFYIADTLGELGLFYRLCDIAFMGGSLVAHGGQNPLEPARLSVAILSGPHVHNFAEIYKKLPAAAACIMIKNAEELAAQLSILFANSDKKTALQKNAKQWVESQSGTAKKLLQALEPIFSTQGNSK